MTAQRSAADRVGDYTLLTRLGEGGMGIVHLARARDGSRVALKVLRPHIVGDAEARERLAREVASLERVRSPWVAEFLDADPWAETPYVVTRYVPGLSLHQHVVEEGPVDGRDLAWLAGCLAEGLASVHASDVLHRDVKPSNVLMEGRTPILIDFGLARVADDPRLTQTGWFLGTPGYLAPEILYGDEATPATDVHAWAATIVYAATGRPPYGKGPSMAIMDRARRGEHDLAGMTGEMRAVVDAALAPDPLDRPSLHEVLAWVRPLSTRPDAPRLAPPVAGIDDAGMTLPLVATPPAPRVDDPSNPPPPPPVDLRAAPTLMDSRPATRVYETEVLPDDTPLPVSPRAGAMHQIEREFDDLWGEPEPAPHIPLGERIRRWVAIGCGAVAIGAATAAVPYLAAAAVALGVWLLRTGSLTASSVAGRRELRGRKWWDGLRFALSSPWHLIRAITGSVVLLLWSLGLALSAGLICYAVSAGTGWTLFVGGTTLGVALWSGPGGSRFRSPLARVMNPLCVRGPSWLALCAVLLGVAIAFGGLLATAGIQWLPAEGAPFGL